MSTLDNSLVTVDDTIPNTHVVEDANIGTCKAEAAHKAYRNNSRWFLFLCVGLASYMSSLESSTTFLYLAFATSSLGNHSSISSVRVFQDIVVAVGKPMFAKIADVNSRVTAFIVVLLLYATGFIVVASAHNVQTVVGGTVLYALGSTGLQLLIQVMIADITTLKWRGFASSLVYGPNLINGFVGSNLAASVMTHLNWRWGYGMFAILMPLTLAPLIAILSYGERKAARMGLVPTHAVERAPFGRRILNFGHKMDFVGLVLLGVALSLVLAPLTINKMVPDGWENASIIAMLTTGCVLFIAFGGWEIKYAGHPIVPPRFLRNRSVFGAALIGCFDFMSFYLTFTYLYSYILIVKDWALVDVNYFILTQLATLTMFGIFAGVLLRIFHRYKAVLMGGLLIRLLGVGLMIHSRGAKASTVELVWTQIVQGSGGGLASSALTVGAQASVPHSDVALVIAVVNLITEVGASIGNAIAGAIWGNTMPKNLARYLPNVPQDTRNALYASVVTARASPRGDPVREGVILAYGDTMKVMLIAATAIAILPIAISFMMPDWVLGDEQTAVMHTDLIERRPGTEEKSKGINVAA